MKSLLFAITFVFVLSSQSVAMSARQASTEKVTKYIAALARKESKQYRVFEEFSGEFRSLPTEMESQLLEAFPKHRFLLALMSVSIDATTYGPILLIVVDPRSGNVVGHSWDIFFGSTSAGFRKLLSNYVADSRDDAIRRVKLLFELMAYPSWQAGEASIEGNRIKATLFTGAENPWRIVAVDIDRHFRYGRMHVFNAKTGEEIVKP